MTLEQYFELKNGGKSPKQMARDGKYITPQFAKELMKGYADQCLSEIKEDIVKLQEYARDENWSMVEIQAEEIKYHIE